MDDSTENLFQIYCISKAFIYVYVRNSIALFVYFVSIILLPRWITRVEKGRLKICVFITVSFILILNLFFFLEFDE